MILDFCPDNMRGTVHNRWGESIGIFVQRHGYWEFVADEYRKEKLFTPGELQWLEAKEMELNL